MRAFVLQSSRTFINDLSLRLAEKDRAPLRRLAFFRQKAA